MKQDRALNITIKDSLFDPDRRFERFVQVRRTGESRPLYRVYLYLEGTDLPFIQRVTYELHPTFSPRTLTVDRSLSNPFCKIDIWTWGIFTVHADLEDRQGRTSRISHHLEYASDLRESDLQYKTS